MSLFDDRICALGEGPLWHPERGQLFWFDIIGKRMLSRDESGPLEWAFDAHVSAAGWTGRDTLLIASETRLLRFDLGTGAQETLCELEADNPDTRSNDGRADPKGGFWIGTMGKTAAKGQGRIYRYFAGELRCIVRDLSIPNAIAFAPSGDLGYFADSAERKVWRMALDRDGWPKGAPEPFLHMGGDGPEPDGAVVDARGTLWLSEWGGARVRAWDASAQVVASIDLPAPQPTCPAFGGEGLSTLHVTSATAGMGEDARGRFPQSGMTFAFPTDARGQAEHQVLVP